MSKRPTTEEKTDEQATREGIIQHLVSIKFPNFTNSELFFCVSAYGDQITEEIPPRMLEAIKYRDEVSAFPNLDLHALYRQECARVGESPTLVPHTKDGWFYDQPVAIADFSFWTRAEYWTPDEAVALSLNRSPRVVNEKSLAIYRGKTDFANEYFSRLELVARAITVNVLSNPIPPIDFVGWAKKRKTDLPDELTEVLGIDGSTNRLTTEGGHVLSAERGSLLKLVYGMAIKSYGYDPEKTKNPATGTNRGSIAADLEQLGLSIDDETIRKYLKEAEQRFGNPHPKPHKPYLLNRIGYLVTEFGHNLSATAEDCPVL